MQEDVIRQREQLELQDKLKNAINELDSQPNQNDFDIEDEDIQSGSNITLSKGDPFYQALDITRQIPGMINRQQLGLLFELIRKVLLVSLTIHHLHLKPSLLPPNINNMCMSAPGFFGVAQSLHNSGVRHSVRTVN